MGGLYQPKHDSYRDYRGLIEDEIRDRTGWRRIVSVASTLQLSKLVEDIDNKALEIDEKMTDCWHIEWPLTIASPA